MKIVEQEVTCIDYMGSDLRVVDAARVSFNKKSDLDEDGNLRDSDKRLINYLGNHNHWTPFGHCFLTLRIKAPIFIARQLGKHQVGLVWNEVSRRYVDSEPEFYLPDSWRLRAENKKQGSSDEVYDKEIYSSFDGTYDESSYLTISEHMNALLRLYQSMIDHKICPEQARMVLPQNMMTEWYWSGSLAAFARVCNLRLDEHSQKEVRDVAKMISDICAEVFPESWKVLCNG